jgi:pilus assembly protein CpaF
MGVFSFLDKLFVKNDFVENGIRTRRKKKKVEKDEADIDKYTFKRAIDFIIESFETLLKNDINDNGLSAEELEKKKNIKGQIKDALKKCSTADIPAKLYVISYIIDLLTVHYGVNEENINYIINFDHEPSLSVIDKFDILLYKYKKQHGYYAFAKIVEKYELDRLREEEGQIRYYITKEDIEHIYSKENIELDYYEKLDILASKIYAKYKGNGCIDELRDMVIDGISGGVSGLPEDFVGRARDYDLTNEDISALANLPRSCDSVWLFFKGKSIHLRFLSFGTYKELERVCMNIYTYGKPGQLSRKQGYIANKMADGSRIVVFRPPFSETWIFFNRKFDIENADPEVLIQGENKEYPISLVKFLMKSCQTVGVTGEQGVGKSTFQVGIVRYIYETFNIRTIEMFFEMHLRKHYPDRNIVGMQETPDITSQDALDISKKSDGTVCIVGEVAQDSTASTMIQSGQVAYKSQLFGHHAKTTDSLVKSLRNSTLKTGVFSNEKIAEEQIVEVVSWDCHLASTIEGFRYIERITEIIPIHYKEYPTKFRNAKTSEERELAFMETQLEYFKKMTDNRTFICRNIVEFNLEQNRYEVKNPISKSRVKEMMSKLTEKDKKEFSKFLELFPNIIEEEVV